MNKQRSKRYMKLKLNARRHLRENTNAPNPNSSHWVDWEDDEAIEEIEDEEESAQ